VAELPTEDLQKTRDQLREEIREARGTLKDLRYEIKTARELADSTRSLTAELAETQVRDILEAEVTKQVTALGNATEQQMSRSTAKVIAEFDKLRDILLGHERVADSREERSIPELLQDPAILARARRAATRNTTPEADRE
jgi:paraquat-inducible protein B